MAKFFEKIGNGKLHFLCIASNVGTLQALGFGWVIYLHLHFELKNIPIFNEFKKQFSHRFNSLIKPLMINVPIIYKPVD